METLQQFVQRLRGIVEYPLFSLGGTHFTLWTIGDGSLTFVSRVWTRASATRPSILRNELHDLITEQFEEARIRIPSPQRDVHIKSGKLAAAST